MSGTRHRRADREGGRARATSTATAATARPRRRKPQADAAAEPKLTPIRGADAMLARYMTESLEIPTATSFRTLAVDDARRAAGAS